MEIGRLLAGHSLLKQAGECLVLGQISFAAMT
jgi:hypothetical protein